MGKMATDILQIKEQNHMELNKLNSLQQFVSQWLGDMKYLLTMVGNNLKNFCSSSLSLSAGDCNWIIVFLRYEYILGKATFRKLWFTSSVFLPHVCLASDCRHMLL